MNKYFLNKKQAVALSYDHANDQAPKVLAKAKGDIAIRMLEKAKKYNVPIQEDPTLVELLSKLKINQTIPEELYHAVAEIFAFLYRMDQSLQKKNKNCK